MNGKTRLVVMLAALCVIILVGMAGLFQPLDNALRDLRFGVETRHPTGSIVFVDIDSRSLSTIGVWPWPRHIHADILDRLMELGATDVAFDVDFSAASSEAEDGIFENALSNAGGYAMLAAFRQHDGDEDEGAFNLPLERFRRVADPVVVNVRLDARGMVRTYPLSMALGGHDYPSLAAALAVVDGSAGTGFHIDYSIDPNGVDRISAADLLAGRIDPSRISGKQVVIGASALELRDLFVVPRYGIVPGALLQILAAETLKQGRALQPAGFVPAGLGVLLAALGLMLAGRRWRLVGVLVGALALSTLAEIVALMLQLDAGILLDTTMIHVAAAVFVLGALVSEIKARGLLHLMVSHERDATRMILDRIVADNFDGVVVIEQGGQIVAASRFAEEVLGSGLVGRRAEAVVPAAIITALQRLFTGSGTGMPQPEEFTFPGHDRIIEYVITRSEVPTTRRRQAAMRRVACLTFRDITERRRAEERLHYLGTHDPLTGALSRTRLVEMIEAALLSDRGRERGIATIAVDLRRFRMINDTLGHSHGDTVLKQVVTRLKSMGPDAVARLGGDSFVLLVPETDPERLKGFCETVAQWLSFPYELGGEHQAIIAASAGATTSLVSGNDPEVLLSHADMALSAAKRIAGNGVTLFTPELDERLKDKLALDAELHRALGRNEISVVYQPQVDLATGRLAGVEALVRWVHPELGPVSPARFIPAAEETGLIIALGRFVLEEACRTAASWPQPLRLAVNVSPVQFELGDVVADVRAALDRSGLAADRLDIEITEGVFVANPAPVVAVLAALKALGVGVALDDFGTGYSSLSYLGRLPIDKVKIDQSFVKRLPGDQEAGAIVRAVMTLSETLGKVVVAEGIETADQAWMLRIMGCQLGQGYHFGRPMSGAALLGLLAQPADHAIAV